MYHFCFVIFVTLANVAAAFESNCTSYYVLVKKYYDSDIETTTLDMYTENRYAYKLRIYNQKINWETCKIHTDVPDLKRFDHNCVVDLECLHVERECLKKIKPKIITGTDYRILDKDNTTISNISTDHGKKEKIPEDNLELTTVTNINKTNTTISTDHDIEDETLKKTNLSEPDHRIVNSTPDDSLEITTVTNADKTNTTILTDYGIDIENETLKKTNLSEPDHNIVDSTPDDNLELTTEISSAKETTDLNNDEIDLKSKPHNVEGDPVVNKNMSVEETTDINKEVILLKNETALHNSNNTRLSKSGKYSSPTNEQTAALQAGKIAAGIMGAGALVAVVLVTKKMIVGCLQSGVYNIPA